MVIDMCDNQCDNQVNDHVVIKDHMIIDLTRVPFEGAIFFSTALLMVTDGARS